MTALMWAASNGSLGVVAELLKFTTDDDDGEIEYILNNSHAFSYFSLSDCYCIALFSINYATTPLRYTALLHAIDKGHEDVALFLLSKGASPS
jgi:ankyrin repeat protein